MLKLKMGVAAIAFALSATASWAECGIESGSVSILSNDFAALHAIAAAAETCASDKVKITKNQTKEHKNIQVSALSTEPSTYSVAIIATNSIVPLLSDNLIRPLDDLVAKYGQQLKENQLIRIDGKVMAIAFMANAQHMFYRGDLLKKNGIEPPKSYEDIVAAAKVLREKGGIKNPLAFSFKPGWDVAAEFVNAYLGTGGDFFESGTANVAINNDNGKLVLNTLKSLVEYIGPDFATLDANAQKPLWDAGETAIAVNWGSRAGSYIDDKAPNKEVAENTDFAAAPTIGGGNIPSAALWWDGFTIAKNISDEDAEASFRAMMVGISPDMMKANMDKAVWLIDGYEPTKSASGVVADINGGARPYPMLPYMGLLHNALAENLSEFLQGREDADQALQDVSSAYTTAAKEAGFIK